MVRRLFPARLHPLAKAWHEHCILMMSRVVADATKREEASSMYIGGGLLVLILIIIILILIF